MNLHGLLLGTVLPALLAGVMVWLGRRWRVPRRRRQWLVPAALGGGYLAGVSATLGWPGCPPSDSTEWVHYVALAGMLLGIAESRWWRSSWARWSLRGLLTFGMLWLLLNPLRRMAWTDAVHFSWMGGLWLGMIVGWCLVASAAGRWRGAAGPAGLVLVSFGLAAVVLFSGFLKFGQAGAALAATLLSCTALSTRKGALRVSPGGDTVVITVLYGLGVGAWLYAEMPASSAVLLAGSPATIWLASRLVHHRPSRYRTAIAAVALAAAPAIAAALLALRAYAGEAQDAYY